MPARLLIKWRDADEPVHTGLGREQTVGILAFDARRGRLQARAFARLRVDTYRSGGKGGQHVNTTDSAVRITHIPTGIVVQCQNERSQHKNRELAMKVLRSRLYELEIEKRQAETRKLDETKRDISFGSQIRTYTLQPYRLVKDHRTKFEMGDVDRVLDGDLDPFLKAYLLSRRSVAKPG